MSRRFVLLDRDGTLIAERHYLRRAEEVELLPNAAAGLRLLRAAGFGLVVVTNQSGLGRGYFTAADLEAVHDRLRADLAAAGVTLDGVYVCPHTPEDACGCRKPEPGLGLAAARQHGFDLGAAVVVGDKMCDLDLGRRLGAATVLVRTGYGAALAAAGPVPAADLVADDLLDAARRIAAG